ncbi:MAG TPA: winged helix DNA-binding domain-containing protein [Candidatus Dormibacteraeota bacterium]|nr:winged helix DNA-binding domain-containing protein [Candidatus Dormibacteraeota bacterium]
MLLEREEVDAVTAIERLAGLQAQYSPSPYIGLWSRLRDFRREELEMALKANLVYKATLMRGTLHLVSARQFDFFRVASRYPRHVWTDGLAQLKERGVDVEALREEILVALDERPLKKPELQQLFRHRIPSDLPDWVAFSVVIVVGATMNHHEDARFGHFAGSRYRRAPLAAVDPEQALRSLVTSYLAAFGPATRGDIAQWLGRPVSVFGAALDSLELVSFVGEDGRRLVDLPGAPRPDPSVAAPVRFLPKWDNLLLGYVRRERVLSDDLRKIVIRKNGDVLPTFLVDGMVAGAWEAPLKGRASMTLTPFAPLPARQKRAVRLEAEALLAWLRPDADKPQIAWKSV